MISMLAEAPVKTRAAVIDGIYNQVLHGDAQRGANGVNAWISGGASTLGLDNAPGFPSDPGIPLLGTVGLDYARDEWLVGAAVSLGQEQAGFAQGFGGFKQDEVTASLYGSYRLGPLWGLGVLSGGTIHDQVDRSVPIGITVQNNQGSTGGSNYSLAAFAGYDFIQDWLTHGPVAGITAQRVHIDGFPEFGSFTALAFGSQTRDSDVTALGYRASVRADAWQPFAQFTWNHEFASTERMVAASLTTIAAPSYSMPAIALGNDWGTGTVGTTVACGPGCTTMIGFTAQFGQNSATSYGGQVGLTISF
jgi:outer membrane lipase/esterase